MNNVLLVGAKIEKFVSTSSSGTTTASFITNIISGSWFAVGFNNKNDMIGTFAVLALAPSGGRPKIAQSTLRAKEPSGVALVAPSSLQNNVVSADSNGGSFVFQIPVNLTGASSDGQTYLVYATGALQNAGTITPHDKVYGTKKININSAASSSSLTARFNVGALMVISVLLTVLSL